MPKHPVLILDDDEHWLAQHKGHVKKAGIDCYITQNSREAIEFAIKHKIKVALIDEILFVPPISNSQGELQRWQGQGVIREIVEAGLVDTHFIFITAAPAKRSGWNTPAFLQDVFLQEVTSLRRISGVMSVINKSEIESNPEDSYAHLIDIIKRVNSNTENSSQLVQTESLLGNLRKLLARIRINISFALINVNIGAVNVSSKTQGNQIGNQHNRFWTLDKKYKGFINMTLSGPQRRELQDALIDAFPDIATLERMLAYELDKNLRAIAGEGNLQDIVFKLIQAANAEGWVEDLIRAARNSNSGNERLQAIAEGLPNRDGFSR